MPAPRDITAGHFAGELPDPGDQTDAFRDADRRAGIEQIESVGAFQAVIIGRQHQVKSQKPFAFLFVRLEQAKEHRNAGGFEIVLGKLNLFAMAYISIAQAFRPDEIVDAIDFGDEGADALEPVGNLATHGVKVYSPGLLKVCELRDFKPVKQNLPADAPRTQRRRFPVVLFEAQIMLPQIDSEGLEAAKIEILRVGWRRLEDYLVLIVFLNTVGIVPITSVRRPSRGHHISHPIRLGSENTKKSFRGHGAGADFEIVRLLESTSMPVPVAFQGQDDLLKVLHPHMT